MPDNQDKDTKEAAEKAEFDQRDAAEKAAIDKKFAAYQQEKADQQKAEVTAFHTFQKAEADKKAEEDKKQELIQATPGSGGVFPPSALDGSDEAAKLAPDESEKDDKKE